MTNPLVESLFALDPIKKIYTNAKAKQLNVACPSLLYGVELEIENAAAHPDWRTPGMSAKEDASLRNHGVEFVTDPMTLSVLGYVLDSFFTKANLTDFNYSERCSVHVHANCRDMTMQQVATVALLYQVFEHLLYKFVGNERHKNIFCVPWYETTLTYNVVSLLDKVSIDKIKSWMKYTGLNLLPLLNYGTVEFRQMAGTHDKAKILAWCNLIGCMFQFAKTHTLEEVKTKLVNLNTTSAYRNSLDEVFGEWADYLRTVGPEYELLLEEGVLAMKYSILNPKESARELPSKKPLRATLDENLTATSIIYDEAVNSAMRAARTRAPQPSGFRAVIDDDFERASGAIAGAAPPPPQPVNQREWIVYPSLRTNS
jgi:hypothetical protein